MNPLIAALNERVGRTLHAHSSSSVRALRIALADVMGPRCFYCHVDVDPRDGNSAHADRILTGRQRGICDCGPRVRRDDPTPDPTDCDLRHGYAPGAVVLACPSCNNNRPTDWEYWQHALQDLPPAQVIESARPPRRSV